MSTTFSPVAALSLLIKLDKKVGLVLVAGLAALAVVAMASSYFAVADLPTIGLMALYMAGIGAIIILAANVLHHPVWGFVLGGFLTLFVIATVTAFFVSAVFRGQGIIYPTYCLVKPWEPCADRETEVLRRHPSAIERTDVQPAEIRAASATVPGVRPAEYRVYVQFAGLIAREDIVGLIQALRSAGWQMQGERGERTPVAQGLNEVRYGRPEDEQAARALAAAVSTAGIGSRPPEVKLTPMIGDAPLEIWLSN